MILPRFKVAYLIPILVLLLAACTSEGLLIPVTPLTQQSPLATPPVMVTSEPGATSISGRLIRFDTGESVANQSLSLHSLLCPPDVTTEEDKREQCVYMIDEAFDPSTLTDEQGRFEFRNIEGGDYVIMVGNWMTEYVVLANDFNQPLIWKVEPDQQLELGDLVVDLP